MPESPSLYQKCNFLGCTCQNFILGQQFSQASLRGTRRHLATHHVPSKSITNNVNNFSRAVPNNNSIFNHAPQFTASETLLPKMFKHQL